MSNDIDHGNRKAGLVRQRAPFEDGERQVRARIQQSHNLIAINGDHAFVQVHKEGQDAPSLRDGLLALSNAVVAEEASQEQLIQQLKDALAAEEAKRSGLSRKVNEMASKQEEQVAALKAEHEKAIANLKSDNESEVKKIKAEHAEQRKMDNDVLKGKTQELSEALDLVKTTAAERDDARKTVRRLTVDVTGATNKVKELEFKIGTAKKALA